MVKMNQHKLDMGKRIAIKREAKGLDQTALATLLKITPQAVQQWEAGQTSPKGKNLESLVKVLGCTKAYLFGEENENFSIKSNGIVSAWEVPEDLDPDVYVIIPHVDIKFSAGDGRIAEFEHVPQKFFIARTWEWIQEKHISPKNLITIEVEGDSMEPKLPSGSIVILDKSINTIDQIQSDKVYAIRYGDELKIKRLSRRYDGALIIDSDNNSYGREIVEPDQLEHISIIGKYISHTYDGDL